MRRGRIQRSRTVRKDQEITEGHPLQWVVEPLMEQPSYLQRAMFGCLGCYLYGRLMLVLAARREPWRGLLVPTAREHHAALLREERALIAHPVLAKWLYLAESSDVFEEVAQRLVAQVLAGDPRIGVEPRHRAQSPRIDRKPHMRGRRVQGRGGIGGRGIDSARAPTFNRRRVTRPR
jgi:hypothetical protein